MNFLILVLILLFNVIFYGSIIYYYKQKKKIVKNKQKLEQNFFELTKDLPWLEVRDAIQRNSNGEDAVLFTQIIRAVRHKNGIMF